MIKSVIFDFDGTLANTNQLIFDSFNFILKKYKGISFTNEELIAHFGPPEAILIKKIFGVDNFQEIFDTYQSFYRTNHKKMVYLYPGLSDLLWKLRENNVYLSIFTGKGLETTFISLDELDIKHFFKSIITGDDVKNFKPSGDGILKILSDSGIARENTIMVGDSIHDILAAREASINVCSVIWDSYCKKEVEQENPELCFNSVSELENFLLTRL